MAKNSKKSTKIQRYAPISLGIAAVALLATLILLAIKVVSLALSNPLGTSKLLTLWIWIAAGLVLIGLAVFAILDPKRVKEFLTGRQAKYGSNALIMLVAFVGILVVVNVIVFQNPKKWDLTEDKSNSLAPETLQTLAALPSGVHAIGFYSKNLSDQTARNLLDRYASNSKGKFTYEFIDPDQNPLAAQQAGISGDGKIYLQMADRHEIVSTATEQEITAAMIRLMNPGSRAVYFLTGHGEGDIEGQTNRPFTKVMAALVAKNYTVKSLNLLAQNAIPADALAIVITGPTDPISDQEMALLQAYVSQGGSLVVMEEPAPLTNTSGKQDPLVDYLASTWGIGFGNDIVIDPNSNQPIVAFAYTYGSHPITDKLQGTATFFPTARSLFVTKSAPTAPVVLVSTYNTAWGETDLASIQSGTVSNDPNTDIAGPINLAMAATNSTTNSRLVVFGDADFASDTYFSQYGNGDLLINAIDWAAQQESLINLTASTPITRTLKLPSGPVQILLVISVLCLLPGLVIVGGVVAWLSRRSKG
jgi:ABC-type uncharacterized transport system involved in gliding motility auxiliary subunit